MKWLTRLAILAVFLLGAVAGTALGIKFERERFLKMQRNGPASLTEQALNVMTSEVKLEPQQRGQLREILNGAQPELTAAENARRSRVLTVMETVRTSALAMLDTDQQKRYEQLHERMKRHFRPVPGDEPATAAAAFGSW